MAAEGLQGASDGQLEKLIDARLLHWQKRTELEQLEGRLGWLEQRVGGLESVADLAPRVNRLVENLQDVVPKITNHENSIKTLFANQGKAEESRREGEAAVQRWSDELEDFMQLVPRLTRLCGNAESSDAIISAKDSSKDALPELLGKLGALEQLPCALGTLSESLRDLGEVQRLSDGDRTISFEARLDKEGRLSTLEGTLGQLLPRVEELRQGQALLESLVAEQRSFCGRLAEALYGDDSISSSAPAAKLLLQQRANSDGEAPPPLQRCLTDVMRMAGDLEMLRVRITALEKMGGHVESMRLRLGSLENRSPRRGAEGDIVQRLDDLEQILLNLHDRAALEKDVAQARQAAASEMSLAAVDGKVESLMVVHGELEQRQETLERAYKELQFFIGNRSQLALEDVEEKLETYREGMEARQRELERETEKLQRKLRKAEERHQLPALRLVSST
eukprot:TRINITY_DN58823_c0_g1_i1.p1 TRINITY_DN58823_c0_g1~~TRINITY_DN58823_c0_g1_i1.p1  ORF type:complete len:451 (-),score=165.02 TRINITY_DN58823_c0_g1_i1:206-1558(-)